MSLFLLSAGGYLFIFFLWCLWRIIRASRSPLHRLPGPPRSSAVAGNMTEAFGIGDQDYFERLTDSYGAVVKFHGPLGSLPRLCIIDPGAVQHILVTDVESWGRTKVGGYVSRVLFGPGLLVAEGDAHKRARKIMNPMFSTSYIRELTPLFYDVAYKLRGKIASKVDSTSTGSIDVDVLELASSTALDLLGTAGIGYDFDSLNRVTPYQQAIKEFVSTTTSIRLTLPFLKILSKVGPYSARAWFMDTVCPWFGSFGRNVAKLRSILKVLDDMSLQVFRESKSALDECGDIDLVGKDVMSNFISATKSDPTRSLTEEEIVGQITTLIFAGHEPASIAITRLLDILAAHPDTQNKLRSEVASAFGEKQSDLDFDTIMSLPYLDCVCREALRLYPPALRTTRREALRDVVVPLAFPLDHANGQATSLFIPKGTAVDISIAAMNRNTSIWGEDAKCFNPERWLALPTTPAFSKIPGVYSSTLTFSGGPRACLGYKFALLEIKIIISILSRSFQFSRPVTREIKWKYALTQYPVVTGDEDRPRLPLSVSFA